MNQDQTATDVFLLLAEAHALAVIKHADEHQALNDDWIPAQRIDALRQHLATHPKLENTPVGTLWLVWDEESQELIGQFTRHGLGIAAQDLALLPWRRFEQTLGVEFQFSIPAVEHVLAALEHWPTPKLTAASNSHTPERSPAPSRSPCPEMVDDDALLTFLPALFQQPFAQLSPVDLALLNGRLPPYPIPSPYPEPSDATLSLLQARFRRLPAEQQRKFLRFVAQLPVQLTPRVAVRSWLEPRMVRLDELDEMDGRGES